MNTVEPLDVYDSLLIRAIRCRTNPSLGFLKRVWSRRCRIDIEYVDKDCITVYLLDLIQRLNLISLSDFANRMHPSDYEYRRNIDTNIKGYDYDNNLLNVCCSIIRLCKPEKLTGVHWPTRFTRIKK